MDDRIKNRKAELIEEIKRDEKFTRFFEDYNEDSITGFIEQYAYLKALLESRGDFYQRMEERDMEIYFSMAEDCLKEIQYKKLFDLECQWRAEQISIPGIEVTYDFQVLGNNVLYNQVIDPVTEEEIKLYQEYLQSPHADTSFLYDYSEFTSQLQPDDEDNTDLPPYIEFHHIRNGSSMNHLLPDVRGEKEKFYMKLASGDKDKSENPSPEPKKQRKASMVSLQDYIIEAAEMFGDNELAGYVREVQEREIQEDHKVREAYDYLCKLKEMWPVNSHSDWRQSLMASVKLHENQYLIEILPAVWEEYRTKLDANIAVEKNDELIKLLRNFWVEKILLGRERNGEPRDLNF